MKFPCGTPDKNPVKLKYSYSMKTHTILFSLNATGKQLFEYIAELVTNKPEFLQISFVNENSAMKGISYLHYNNEKLCDRNVDANTLLHIENLPYAVENTGKHIDENDEEMNKAIEESLRLSKQEEDKKHQNESIETEPIISRELNMSRQNSREVPQEIPLPVLARQSSSRSIFLVNFIEKNRLRN